MRMLLLNYTVQANRSLLPNKTMVISGRILKGYCLKQEASINTQKLFAINTTTNGGLHYIHSGTYTELAAHYDLDAII